MDKKFHPILYNGYNYLSTQRLKLIHVSKRGSWPSRNSNALSSTWQHFNRNSVNNSIYSSKQRAVINDITHERPLPPYSEEIAKWTTYWPLCHWRVRPTAITPCTWLQEKTWIYFSAKNGMYIYMFCVVRSMRDIPMLFQGKSYCLDQYQFLLDLAHVL